ncbi:MAG: indole-3-glycerol phosphate synthase TrpC [Nitrospirae bacterium]|nr:indole-3-glycerol phosphate synthase TrpC [Nitrospirota bacterium]
MLKEILSHKKEELNKTKSLTPLADLKARLKDTATIRSFKTAITREKGSPVKLIAELKKASPSKGLIREDFNLSEIVSIYNRKDVAAISVLTEERYFSGKLEYLHKVRKKTLKPILRKDFIIDEYQVYESRVNNADAILLIASALEKQQLSDLYELAQELSLDCLVEVHDWKELDTALYSEVEIIGINNRDLKTLNVNLKATLELLKDIPEDIIVVSESGFNTRADVELMEATRTDAILVGSAIMKAGDIGAKIDELMGRTE